MMQVEARCRRTCPRPGPRPARWPGRRPPRGRRPAGRRPWRRGGARAGRAAGRAATGPSRRGRRRSAPSTMGAATGTPGSVPTESHRRAPAQAITPAIANSPASILIRSVLTECPPPRSLCVDLRVATTTRAAGVPVVAALDALRGRRPRAGRRPGRGRGAAPGSTSYHGTSTKARSWARGWGRVRTGSSETTSCVGDDVDVDGARAPALVPHPAGRPPRWRGRAPAARPAAGWCGGRRPR